MPRQLRIEYAGARYHVMSRGNRREFILGTPEDKKIFLETLAETCEQTGWMVHSYVLMGNHFHLLLETPEPNLTHGMRWLQGTYGGRYNRRHGLVGHVWQGRFKSPLISDESDDAFLAVSNYIHMNPVVAGQLLDSAETLLEYPWSSFPALCGAPSKRPDWLHADALFHALELSGDSSANRRKFAERMELRCREALNGALDEEEEVARRKLLGGWYIGEVSFRDRMKDYLEKSVKGEGGSYTGKAKRLHDEAAAYALVKEKLGVLGCSLEDLKDRSPGDLEKQMVAAVLRKRTTMTRRWIVEALSMGSVGSVYNAVKAVEGFKGREKGVWDEFQN